MESLAALGGQGSVVVDSCALENMAAQRAMGVDEKGLGLVIGCVQWVNCIAGFGRRARYICRGGATYFGVPN